MTESKCPPSDHSPRHQASAYTPLLDALSQIEAELRRLGVWSGQPPPDDAFASEMPFCADTMAFEVWLQWVLVARFRALAEGNHGLPERCQITPMAEESLRHADFDTQRLLQLLAALDRLFEPSPGTGD